VPGLHRDDPAGPRTDCAHGLVAPPACFRPARPDWASCRAQRITDCRWTPRRRATSLRLMPCLSNSAAAIRRRSSPAKSRHTPAALPIAVSYHMYLYYTIVNSKRALRWRLHSPPSSRPVFAPLPLAIPIICLFLRQLISFISNLRIAPSPFHILVWLVGNGHRDRIGAKLRATATEGAGGDIVYAARYGG